MGQSVFSRQPVDLLISGIWRKKLKKDTFLGDGFVLFFQILKTDSSGEKSMNTSF